MPFLSYSLFIPSSTFNQRFYLLMKKKSLLIFFSLNCFLVCICLSPSFKPFYSAFHISFKCVILSKITEFSFIFDLFAWWSLSFNEKSQFFHVLHRLIKFILLTYFTWCLLVFKVVVCFFPLMFSFFYQAYSCFSFITLKLLLSLLYSN